MRSDPNGDCPKCGEFFNAVGQGYLNTFKNIGNAIMHPIETAQKFGKIQATAYRNNSINATFDNLISNNPLTSGLKEGYEFVNAAFSGDTKKAGEMIGGKLAEGTMIIASEGAGRAFGTVGKLGNASGKLGDLTKAEVKAIQNVVDEAGRPIEVAGSAAQGTRRGVGTNLPIGKGNGTKSDIDYLVAPSAMPYYQGLETKLPLLDP